MKPINLIEHPEGGRFNKVESDEVWNGNTNSNPEKIELSIKSNTFCHVVPAGYWQAAEPIADKILLGCSVGPGFEFIDFQLIDSDADFSQAILIKHPELSKFILP